jgi:Tfp pilus assembly protein PilP
MRRSATFVALMTIASAGAAHAQGQPPVPPQSQAQPQSQGQAPSAQTPPKPAASDAQPPAEPYTYQPAGRRDPFLSLIGSGSMPTPTGRRGEGPAGMMTAEISVSGVVQSRGELVAMVKGPDNKTYIVHHGDKLADGTIKTITPQGLVVVQEVNDPLSLVKQREVRKLLRSLEDAKE